MNDGWKNWVYVDGELYTAGRKDLPSEVAGFHCAVLDKELMKGLRGAFSVCPASPLTASSAL